MNRTNRLASTGISSPESPARVEALEERRLLHAFVEVVNLGPGGVPTLHVIEVTPGTNDTFVLEYDAGDGTITALHNGDPSHPGSTSNPIDVDTFEQIFIDPKTGNDKVTIKSLPPGKELTIYAGEGDDTILIQTVVNGAILAGDEGNDTITDGDGGNSFFGGTGNDTITCFGGNDTVHGNDGNDSIFGGTGHDYLFGDAGADVISAGVDNVQDNADGGVGNDTLTGGRGPDYLYGDVGNDVFHVGGSTSSIAHVYGGGGTDVADADLTDVISASTETVWGVADAAENNNTTATAKNLGTISSSLSTTKLTIHQGETTDKFKFVAGKTGIVSVDLNYSTDTYSAPVDMVLYDSNGVTQLVRASGKGHVGAHLSANVTNGKTYYLGVFKGSGETKGNRDYGFTIGIKTGKYLSDLNPSSASNGWGPYEEDKSNGEQQGGDGQPLKLNGQTYLKGLGTHATSILQYQLNGAYNRFVADVGIDDEVTDGGTVIFRVRGDGGVLLYESPTLTYGSAIRHVDVSVTGYDVLTLEVATSGDGTTKDHADWADARVLANSLVLIPLKNVGGIGSLTRGIGSDARSESDVLYRSNGLLQ